MHGHDPGFLALADRVDLALAGGQPHVGDVQGADLGDAGTGVQRQQGQRAVPGDRLGLDGAQVAQLRPRIQGLRRAPWHLVAPYALRLAEIPPYIEVLQRGQVLVHRRRGPLGWTTYRTRGREWMTAVHPGERCEECSEKLRVEGWL